MTDYRIIDYGKYLNELKLISEYINPETAMRIHAVVNKCIVGVYLKK